jgi:hypothetical protein
MTKKEQLRWRLQSKPTLDDVTTMLDKEIITKDEAREILFQQVNTDDENKALKEQVEFLKDIIDRLSRQPANNVWHYVQGYTPRNPWNTITYGTPAVLCSSVRNLASSETVSDAGSITYAFNTGGTSGRVITKSFGSPGALIS